MPLIILTSSIFYSYLLLLQIGESENASIGPPIICWIAIVLLIRRLKYKKLITNANVWFYYASIKIIFSVLIYYFFYFEPLDQISALRFENQEQEGFQDALYYDYLGSVVANLSYSEWLPYLNATWLSQGIVAYLGIIYSLFGVSQTNYLFINMIISFSSLYFLTSLIGSDLGGRVNYITFLPFVMYYEITPGKECLTNAFVFSLIYFGMAAIRRDRQMKNYIFLSLAIVGLGLIRLNALMLLALFFAALLLINGYYKSILSILVVGVIVVALVDGGLIWDVIYSIQSYSEILASRAQYIDTNSAKYFFFNLLTSDNVFINLILSPLRLVVWLVAPLPLNIFEVIYAVFDGSGYSRFRSAEFAMRTLSSIVMVYMLFNFIKSRQRMIELCDPKDMRCVILLATLIFGLALSTTNFIEGARYRTLIEPLITLLFLMRNRAFRFDLLHDGRKMAG